jgi:hypothetical protein
MSQQQYQSLIFLGFSYPLDATHAVPKCIRIQIAMPLVSHNATSGASPSPNLESAQKDDKIKDQYKIKQGPGVAPVNKSKKAVVLEAYIYRLLCQNLIISFLLS